MAAVRGSDPVFLDTSVLVGGLIDLGATSKASLSIMDAVTEGIIPDPMTAWHCCLEFFSVATRLPEAYRLEATDAHSLLREQVLSRFRVLDLPSSERESLFSMAVADGCGGGRVYDLHIGRIARCAGAKTVVTDNRRHFSALMRYEIRVLSSGEFAAEKRLG